MQVEFQLIPVAFLRSTAGTVRLLFAVDLAGEQLWDGEPILLAEHRPGAPVADLRVEVTELLGAAVAGLVTERAGTAIIELIESAFDAAGQFDGHRMLGSQVSLSASRDAFEGE